jgi:protein SCO1
MPALGITDALSYPRRVARRADPAPAAGVSWRRGLIVGALLIAGCAGNLPSGQLQADVVFEDPPPKPSFTLTDTSGDPYDFAARTEGRLTLLYFGYTFCPDICPVHLAQIAEVFERYPPLARNAEVVFVSVDPDRDTPEIIRSYLDNFNTRFVGLTGSPEELRIAQEAAGVPVAFVSGEGPNYAVDHAAWVLAYAPDGRQHALYPFGTRQTVWANDLRILGAIGAEGS